MSAVIHHTASRHSEGVPGGRAVGPRVRRVALAAFLASIAANAALGVYAVLAPDFGDTQGKILGTSLCVTGAALLALACEPAWERSLLGPVPYVGAALGATGFALVVASIWAEPSSDVVGKATGSILTLAVASALASLLALARLAPGHAWVLAVTLATLAVAATLVAVVPWWGDDPSEWYLRAMGVVLIVLAALVLTVPVLHWVDRSARAAVSEHATAVRHCPYCGSSLSGEAGTVLGCTRCGREFTVTPAGVPSSNLT